MWSLKIISRLLDYPNEELWCHFHELMESVDECSELTLIQKKDLQGWIQAYRQQNLFDAQAAYCGLFDRGRSLSLLLFEHVHGQSRDRGQAMIDLLNEYQKVGLELNEQELPDHLPLYLEYLAILPQIDARQGLDDIAPILGLLAERLKQRGSHYSEVISLLVALAAIEINQAPIADKVRQETRDDTPQAFDQVWDEEQVTFMDTSCCDAKTKAHQRRFTQSVQPQYLDINQVTGGQ